MTIIVMILIIINLLLRAYLSFENQNVQQIVKMFALQKTQCFDYSVNVKLRRMERKQCKKGRTEHLLAVSHFAIQM